MIKRIFEKGLSYKRAVQQSQFKEIVEQFDPIIDWERCKWDIKLYDMKVGEIACRDIWHYDDPKKDKKDVYMLYITGDCYAPTKFFIERPPFMFANQKTVHEHFSEYEKTHVTSLVDYDVPVLYMNRDPHRPTRAETNGTRLFIRAKVIN